jgi:DNA-binding MarR family transcriptional regulator
LVEFGRERQISDQGPRSGRQAANRSLPAAVTPTPARLRTDPTPGRAGSLRLRKQNLRAILACVQATTPSTVIPGQAPARDDLAGDLYALVIYLHKNCNADLFEAMGMLELTITQIKLLHQLELTTDELTLKEAAERIPVSLPAASRTVDDLVRRGMVERHEDVEDRRMKRIQLTDAGRAAIRRLNAARLDGFEQFTESLTEDERRLLAGALSKLLRRDELAVCRPEGL